MNQTELIQLHCKLLDFESARKLLDLNQLKNENNHLLLSAAWRIASELKDVWIRNSLIETLGKELSDYKKILLARLNFENNDLESAKKIFNHYFTHTDLWIRWQSGIGLLTICLFEKDFLSARYIIDQLSCYDSHEEFSVVLFLLKAQILHQTKKQDLAYKQLAIAQKLAKESRNFYLLLQSYLVQIEISLACLDHDLARLGIHNASLILPANANFASCNKVKILKEKITNPQYQFYESESKTFLLSENLYIDLSSQVIMINLLKLLIEAGTVGLTKEQIYCTLWGGEYHPLRSDNKIYVTIKRLRKLLNDDGEKAKILIKEAIIIY